MTFEEIDLWVSIEQVLTPEEFKLIEQRHKLNMTLEQIGEEVGLSVEPTYRRFEGIYNKLKNLL